MVGRGQSQGRGSGRGRGAGRGRGRRAQRRGVRGFLRPCLLVTLSQGEGHGYSMLDELEKFGFDKEAVDPSLVYRALRDMESAGWVSSSWGDESQGPRRRVYQILPEGTTHLEEWATDLRRARDEINQLLNVYEKI